MNRTLKSFGMVAALLPCLVGCDLRGTDASVENSSGAMVSDSNRAIAAFQSELLDVAFAAARAIPIEPHLKERCRAQEAVVAACLELDQPERATAHAGAIGNWRRGTACADVALYWARRNQPDRTAPLLKLAAHAADAEQDWQRDRIRAKIAQVHLLLGQHEQAAAYEVNAESEAGHLHRIKATLVEPETFDEQIKQLDAGLASSNFDLVRNSLDALAEIFNRLYTDEPRRSIAEQKIRDGWTRLPVTIRVELLMKLARFALDHQDNAKALELLHETRTVIEGGRLLPEFRVPTMARLAELRYRAGQTQQALQEAAEVVAVFEAERMHILSIDRAEALRPLAEAYQAMGDTASALNMYRRVIEAGVENPNSRPRAEDLSATCASMAVHKVEPDVELWNRIRAIAEGLADPW